MRLALPVVALALALLPAAHAAEVPADTGTTKVEFTPKEWVDVGLSVHGVTVDRVKLHPAGPMTSLMLKHDEPNRGRVVVTNGTDRRVSPAIAIAVFDAGGNLLAAANTGIRIRSLDPGESREMDIHFGGVFRHIEQGRTLYVSLEY
jgi:hypothetical protein